jgi:hypothetical protein
MDNGMYHWNCPQNSAIVHNLIYPQSSANKARLDNWYRQVYEIATVPHSGAGQ